MKNINSSKKSNVSNTDVILKKLEKMMENILIKTTNGKYIVDLQKSSSVHTIPIKTYADILNNVVFNFDKLLSAGYFKNNSRFKEFSKYINTTNYDLPSTFTVLMLIEFLYLKRKFGYIITNESLHICNKIWNLFNANEIVYREDLINILKHGLDKKIFNV